jgi:hypothetical protein
MSSLVSKAKAPRAYVPTSALAREIHFEGEMMQVFLQDGRIVAVPVLWFPRLSAATARQRRRYRIGGGGRSIHWPDIDEDLSVAGLLAGADWGAA